MTEKTDVTFLLALLILTIVGLVVFNHLFPTEEVNLPD